MCPLFQENCFRRTHRLLSRQTDRHVFRLAGTCVRLSASCFSFPTRDDIATFLAYGHHSAVRTYGADSAELVSGWNIAVHDGY